MELKARWKKAFADKVSLVVSSKGTAKSWHQTHHVINEHALRCWVKFVGIRLDFYGIVESEMMWMRNCSRLKELQLGRSFNCEWFGLRLTNVFHCNSNCWIWRRTPLARESLSTSHQKQKRFPASSTISPWEWRYLQTLYFWDYNEGLDVLEAEILWIRLSSASSTRRRFYFRKNFFSLLICEGCSTS